MSDLVEKKMDKKPVKKDDEKTLFSEIEKEEEELNEEVISSVEKELNTYGKRFVKQVRTYPPDIAIVEVSEGKNFMRDIGTGPIALDFTNECTKPFKEFAKQTTKILKALAASAITYKEDVICFTVKKSGLFNGAVKKRATTELKLEGETYYSLNEDFNLFIPVAVYEDNVWAHLVGFAMLIHEDTGAPGLVERVLNFYYMEMANMIRDTEVEKMSEKEKERMERAVERKSKIRKDPAEELAEQLKEVQAFYKLEAFSDFAVKFLAYSFVACYNGKAFELADDREFNSLTEYYVNSYAKGSTNAGRNWVKVKRELEVFYDMEQELKSTVVMMCPKGDLNWKYLQTHFGIAALAKNKLLTPSIKIGALNSAKSMIQNIWWPFSNTIDFSRVYCKEAYNLKFVELYKGLVVEYSENSAEYTQRTDDGGITKTAYYMKISTIKAPIEKKLVDLTKKDVYKLYLLCGLNTVQLQKFSENEPNEYKTYVRSFVTVNGFKKFLTKNYSEGNIESLKDFNRTIAKCNLSLKTFCKEEFKDSMKTVEGRSEMFGAFEKTSEKEKREVASKALFQALAKELFPVAVEKPRVVESVFKKPTASKSKEATLSMDELY